MPVFAKPKQAGRSGEAALNNRHEEQWLACGYATAADAVAAVLAEAPATVTAPNGRTLHQGAVRFQETGEVDQTGDEALSLWDLTITYEPADRVPSDEGTVRVAYDTNGGTGHITQCPEGGASIPFANGLDVPLMNGAIGVSSDSVEGVDITVPIFRFTATKVFKVEDLPAPGDVFRLTGRVNDAAVTIVDSFTGEVFSFEAGELKFEGGRRSVRPDGLAEIDLQFEGSPNETDLTVGPITGIAKEGWNYLWVLYEGAVGGTGAGKMQIRKPKAVYVSAAYVKRDFSPLKISV